MGAVVDQSIKCVSGLGLGLRLGLGEGDGDGCHAIMLAIHSRGVVCGPKLLVSKGAACRYEGGGLVDTAAELRTLSRS